MGRATSPPFGVVGVLLSFQSTPSVGRATILTARQILTSLLFQSTPSVGRATSRTACFIVDRGISIHTLRGEGDVCKVLFVGVMLTYFNPRPPWGGRLAGKIISQLVVVISIHALRGEGDHHKRRRRRGRCISIHALRGEGDDLELKMLIEATVFQSTPSVGRATLSVRIIGL